jgi:hypothetical protein
MNIQKSAHVVFMSFVIFVAGLAQAGDQGGRVTYSDGCLENGIISVAFDLEKGFFTIEDVQRKEALLSKARFGLPSGEAPGTITLLKTEDVQDKLGTGKRLLLAVQDKGQVTFGARYGRGEPILHLFSYTLYENCPALVLGFGLKTQHYISTRLLKSQPLAGGELFGARPLAQPLTLNGGAGSEKTLVRTGLSRIALNSLMLTGLVDGQRRTAVWGGLHASAFAKVAQLREGVPGLIAEDPVGRLIDEGETYLAPDTFYLDVYTHEPFDALEKYGRALRIANNAKPHVYQFPVLCGWSVGHVSKLPDVNNSVKLIGEVDAANTCGMTRYTKVAIRLEPDKYHLDTEQGWWDDEHMRQYKHLLPPYDTIAKWSQALRERNGIPYIYMQLGMPSDDFARKYPEYMLFNDNSEVDRQAPGSASKKAIKHSHHQPYVTYDYTDKGYSDYFVKTWRKLREDGIQGVKIDYPETAWRPEGGFDDRTATCNSAYRRAFELMREAMGPEGFIDERNIGESGRPCLDMTAGVVDTQRTWEDSNVFIPEMVSRSGLRWYKNRTVFNYYSDTKALHNLSKPLQESLVTMNFLTSGRLDLATSFSFFTPEITRIVSRSYPHYAEPITARPLDAFTGVVDPQVYDLELTPDWHQIVFYNTGTNETVITTKLYGERATNAVGLKPTDTYHAYEFWTDTYLGLLPGSSTLDYKLKPNCCAMISLRKVQSNPQVLSTDRHLLQGWVELSSVAWNAQSKVLSGKAHVIGGEPFKMVVADNRVKFVKADVKGATFTVTPHPVAGLRCLTLTSAATAEVNWQLQYE